MQHRIAVLADIHGNLTALNAVLADARQQAATDYWFLGDLFLPGPGAEKLYQTLADTAPSVWLQGNWEQGINAVMTGNGRLDDPSQIYFARLTAYLFQKLLDAVFLTEHNMARQLGLSYKVLRRVQKAQRMTQKTADAMERLLQYCVRNQIPLDRYLSEYR